jgi:hypothetical protein
MRNFKNKTAAIIDLQERGYDLDLILRNEFILCIQDMELISPDDLEITEAYIFAGRSRRSDMEVVYAVRSAHNGLKGILMVSYSAFTAGLSIHLWSKLSGRLEPRKQQSAYLDERQDLSIA